ncbi:hypothetical protein G7Z12_04305 [Streptomyces sp. ID38640]|uniref:hypothetical protein n=1 Tax=Streptomyces sp. ID38640 TaxID=1265399 RepID=UPI00140F03F0|nr:hypothetical protein [Streptomyces sp. ID38640]QIK05380.1 hypothetical protein G7Z12_04305 [Streptomyces sp. ID38640]
MPTTLRTGSARGRRQRSVVAGFLATAALTSLALAGSPTPAHAADDPKAGVDEKTYEKDEDVIAKMKEWAPVNGSESVMGYPKGLERDKDGKVKPVSYEDVKRIYDANTAVEDAKKAAKAYADNQQNPSDARRVATALAEGNPEAKTKAENSAEIKNNTTDDKTVKSKDARLDGRPAEAYCGGRLDIPGLENPPPAGACAFVGKLDDRPDSTYPQRGATDGVAGGGKIQYKVQGQTTDESSKTEGWSVGGKFTPKITFTPGGDKGGAGGEAGGEVSFTYSYSSTSLKRVTNTTEQTVETDVPSGKKGYMEGRGNGAYYLGYIVVRAVDADYDMGTTRGERMIAIPARVYVQSSGTTSPVTWFKRLAS